MMTNGALALAKITRRDVLAGRTLGHGDRPKIEKAAAAMAVDGRITLDFSGIEVLSSSYFDEAIWPLWSIVPELYPILVKVPQNALDDLAIHLRANNAAVWCVQKSTGSAPQLFGVLDPILKSTLGRVVERGELTAADLFEADRSVVMTAWSNRLAALHQLRLVRRRKDGRRLIYAPGWKE